MRIRTVRHRGLKRLLESNDARELSGNQASRIRNILAFVIAAPAVGELRGGPPGWRIHRLTGDRAGTWSFSVSGNWRITFELEGGEIVNLDLEDYH